MLNILPAFSVTCWVRWLVSIINQSHLFQDNVSLSSCSLPLSDMIFLQIPGEFSIKLMGGFEQWLIKSTIFVEFVKVRYFNCSVLRPLCLCVLIHTPSGFPLVPGDFGVATGILKIWLRGSWLGHMYYEFSGMCFSGPESLLCLVKLFLAILV